MVNEGNVQSGIEELSPWYKHPWVWVIILFPAMAVVMGLTTAYFAVIDRDTLVKDNYYKYGRGINRQLDLEVKAKELGIKAVISFDEKAGVMTVDVSANDALPASLTMAILHPTLAHKDYNVILKQIEPGRYAGALNTSLKGKYHLQLKSEEQKWILKAYHELGKESSYHLP